MPKIVLAEDDEILAKVLKEELKDAGFKVEHADNGADALKKIRSSKPNLVLLDLLMPKMHGFKVLEELKKMPDTHGTSKIPVVILTMLGRDEVGLVVDVLVPCDDPAGLGVGVASVAAGGADADGDVGLACGGVVEKVPPQIARARVRELRLFACAVGDALTRLKLHGVAVAAFALAAGEGVVSLADRTGVTAGVAGSFGVGTMVLSVCQRDCAFRKRRPRTGGVHSSRPFRGFSRQCALRRAIASETPRSRKASRSR